MRGGGGGEGGGGGGGWRWRWVRACVDGRSKYFLASLQAGIVQNE